jgi:hypothetical protein
MHTKDCLDSFFTLCQDRDAQSLLLQSLCATKVSAHTFLTGKWALLVTLIIGFAGLRVCKASYTIAK